MESACGQGKALARHSTSETIVKAGDLELGTGVTEVERRRELDGMVAAELVSLDQRPGSPDHRIAHVSALSGRHARPHRAGTP